MLNGLEGGGEVAGLDVREGAQRRLVELGMGRMGRVAAGVDAAETARVGCAEDRADVEGAAQIVEYQIEWVFGQAGVFVGGHLSVEGADLKAGLLAVVARPEFHPTSSGDTGRCSAAESRAASMATMVCRTLSAVTASSAWPASASAMFS